MLAELEADLVVVGGDVAAGPLPAETLDALAGLDARYVMGNADRLMVAAYDRGDDPETLEHPIEKLDAWCAQRITREHRDRLAAYEPTVSVDGILFCHGSPRSDEEIITAVSPEARLAPMFEGVEEHTVVCGHTHHQFDRAVLGKRLLNAGSVGMPYEDEPAAYWLLIEDGEPALQPHRLRHRRRRRAAARLGLPRRRRADAAREPARAGRQRVHRAPLRGARYALGRWTLSGRRHGQPSTREAHVTACFRALGIGQLDVASRPRHASAAIAAGTSCAQADRACHQAAVSASRAGEQRCDHGAHVTSAAARGRSANTATA